MPAAPAEEPKHDDDEAMPSLARAAGDDDDECSDTSLDSGEDDKPSKVQRFSATEMSAYMKLHKLLRDPYKAAEALAVSAQIILPGEEGAAIAAKYKDKTLEVPHRTTVDNAFYRADMILMMWRRQQTKDVSNRTARISRN